MNAALALALVAFVLQATTTVAMFVIARAPGWERVRLFAVIALTAGLYSGVDILAVARPWPDEWIAWVVRLNLTFAAVHASTWVLYTFGDERGSWRGVPRWIKRVAIANVVIVSSLALTGLAVEKGVTYTMDLASLGVRYTQPQLSQLGNVAAAMLLITFCLCLGEYIRRAKAGVPGARGLVIGFTLFFACTLEEVLVASGKIHFIFLADLGYLFAVVPVTVQLMRRFTGDARRLADLSARLAGEVHERTQERDAARDALLQQERLAALGRLAAGVGHEVNNPLQYLMFSLEELREATQALSRGDVDESLTNAFEGASRICRVVDGLRSYASPAGETFEPVDVRKVVRSALRVASPQLRHVVAVEVELQDVALVLGDEGQLVQMVVNPLVNAAQSFSASSGSGSTPTIRVRTHSAPDGSVEIEVSDNGPGFSEHVLPRLGEPYLTTKASVGGTGLGMFVTRGLVLAHNGVLTFLNASTGGAVVRITLPAHRMSTPIETQRSTPALARTVRRGRVLLVDDEPLVLGALARGLEKHGYDVVRAGDGATALDLIKAGSFDAIVTDLMMPHMSGMDLAAILATQHPTLRTRMVVITGGVVTPAAEAFVQQNATMVLNKPIEMPRLLEALEALVCSSARYSSAIVAA